MTDTPNTPELNPQDVQDEDDLDVVVMTDEDGTESVSYTHLTLPTT